MRQSKPEAGNKFYNTASKGGWSKCIIGKPTDKNANVLANCVGYGCGRFNELVGSMKYPNFNCNAEQFIEEAVKYGLKISKEPTLGGIMVWQKGATLKGHDGAGHVAIVERIDSHNQIYTSESAYNSTAFYNATRNNNNGHWGQSVAKQYKYRGCIVNPNVKTVAPEPAGDTIKYTVKRGDNLTKIANQFGTTVAKLVALNGIKNPNLIRVGQVLQIQGKKYHLTRLLRKGFTGNDVRELQRTLRDLGYSIGIYGVDGVFGTDTLRAVKAFQKTHKLVQDGLVGTKTAAKLGWNYM